MSECYSFVVNGVPCSTEEEKPLLRYLRDELRLTSVKDGCSEGACGTCTILVDGKAVKACVLSTKRAAGKEIVTVEGLSEAEREAFVYAFGAVGAVQCGFCIPGMVMAGKALLDQNPNPSEAEIKKAIRGNVCRCTGYKKIIEGIALAGAILRGEASVDPALEEGEDYGVGARAFRTDVRDKVLGRGEYCDDLYLDGMAHASAVRSQYPRARVLDIDPSAALAQSKYVVTQSYRTPFTEHAFLEPECAVAFPYKDGVKVYTSDQGVYDTRKEISIMLGWEPERIVVENKLVGGGFGGKEDVSVQHLAVLAALKVGRPVKAKLSRQESIAFHPKRHYMEGTFTLGCDENGIFTGLDCEIHFDTGAYASLCGPVLERACTHSVGPYCYQNTDIRGFGWYTNNPPAGAFRGFGVCQSEFALESNINLLAVKVGISPWEIRFRNAIEPGKALPNGQIADCSTALKETLLAVKDVYEQNAAHAGIACAMKNSGVGVGLPDKGRCKLAVRNGVVELYSAASDIGQGCATVFLQMLAEATGLPLEKLRNMGANSEVAPDSGTTSGSRQTLITGEAVRMAAAELRADLDGAGGDLSALEGLEYSAEFFDPTDKLGADKPNPKSHVAYGFATHVVILDDDGRVKEVYAAHDSGKVVNPTSIQGQIEGGVLMGLGYALTEDFPLKDCVPQAKFGTLGLMRADQIPDIHAIYVEKEELLPFAYGAKGIGEIATIPTAPAAQGAYYARDHILRTSLPMQDTFYKKPAKKAAP